MDTTTRYYLTAVFTAVILLSPATGYGQAPLDDYRVSAGDVLNVVVFGETEISGSYRVGPSGTVSLPLIGTVMVGGRALADAEEEIGAALRRMIRRPAATVSVDEAASERRVYVTGEVQRAGVTVVPFGASVVEAVAAAGPSPHADLRRVRLTDAAGVSQIVDVSGLQTDEPLTTSVIVRYGDSIFVPRLDQRIAVLGQVNTPGEALLPPGERVTVLEAIGRLGGGLTSAADRSAVMLLRQGQTAQIDLRRLLREGDLSENILLDPGDVIVVREADRVSVLGEVRAPATLDVGEPITVLEALARAGSVTAEARLDRAQVLTPTGSIPIDLEGLLMRGEMQYNIVVNPGDVVLVPRAGPETVLIVGAVLSPGVIDIREQEQRDLLRLLTAARPVELANLERVQVFRETGAHTVNMRAVMDGDLQQNIKLLPDDVVVVPELDTFYLVGAASASGPLPLSEGLTLLDVVSRHGQFAVGRMSEVTVIRGQEAGEPEFLVRNMGQAHQGIAPENMLLLEGDIVYIPFDTSRRFDWNDVRNSLWSIGSLLALLGRIF
jgi:polysaccharide biosynthesis/export protein